MICLLLQNCSYAAFLGIRQSPRQGQDKSKTLCRERCKKTIRFVLVSKYFFSLFCWWWYFSVEKVMKTCHAAIQSCCHSPIYCPLSVKIIWKILNLWPPKCQIFFYLHIFLYFSCFWRIGVICGDAICGGGNKSNCCVCSWKKDINLSAQQSPENLEKYHKN